MPGVMMAAGIDAAGDLDLELADLVLAVEIGKASGDLLRDRNRARIGKIAIIEAGAGDDVGDEAGVGRGKAKLLQPREDRRQVALFATCGSTRFCSWLTRISSMPNWSSRSASASICSALASPGTPPMGFSEIVAMA